MQRVSLGAWYYINTQAFTVRPANISPSQSLNWIGGVLSRGSVLNPVWNSFISVFCLCERQSHNVIIFSRASYLSNDGVSRIMKNYYVRMYLSLDPILIVFERYLLLETIIIFMEIWRLTQRWYMLTSRAQKSPELATSQLPVVVYLLFKFYYRLKSKIKSVNFNYFFQF
jgi:hypothetical protein